MSKHREILPKALDIILAHDPDAAVYLSGSVCFGNERADSDIDLNVLLQNVAVFSYPGGKIRDEREGFKFVDAAYDAVPLEIRIFTPTAFEEISDLGGKPWRGYKFLKEEILCDPRGFIRSWKDHIRPWFLDHPEIIALWEQWIVEYADRQRTKGEKLGALIRQFPYMTSALWPYLDERFSKEKTTEQPPPN
jgi:predicted nucleotidyltransferase